ncbi:MAG: DUF5930 domain-containing protein, partial [Pseudomonadota bacterium]
MGRGIDAALRRVFPDRRIRVEAEGEAWELRLSPASQAAGAALGAVFGGWLVLATTVTLLSSLGDAGAERDVAVLQDAYERRIAAAEGALRDASATAAAERGRAEAALAEAAIQQSARMNELAARAALAAELTALRTQLQLTTSE